jgi:type I restriction enzyme M protein
VANETNAGDTGFEEKIWAAADLLRGNLPLAEYRRIILDLVFLKHISDKYDERRQFLEDTNDDVDDKDAYLEVNVVLVPPSARWSLISEAAHTERIGIVIDNAIKAVEQENEWLKDTLQKNYSRLDLDRRRLGDVVDLFTNIRLAEPGVERDILGRAYEFFQSRFAELEGKGAGEFYTPPGVIRLMVEILKPLKGRVYDPCCGSGGMFIQAADFVKRNSGEVFHLAFYGQEVNRNTRNMAIMNLAIRGIEVDLGEKAADTFYFDLHQGLKVQYILANPPFNLNWNNRTLDMDPRWKYGLPPPDCSNFAWVQHMIHHLAPDGKIGIVLANVALSSLIGGEGNIRKNIVKADLVECIIALPIQMFYTTTIPVSLWFISCNKKQKNKTLFIDATEMGTAVKHHLRELTDAETSKIIATYEEFNAGTLVNANGYCAVATIEEIANQDFILTPARYVDIKEQDDDEPFDKKMTRLTRELSEQFQLSRELDDEIQKRLKILGFDV